jgi:hypothetical protein
MRKCFILLLFFPFGVKAQQDSLQIASIFEHILSDGECHNDLRVLCKDIGARLSGSPAADKAILWGFETLKSLKPDTVYLQDIEVPHWTRGNVERAVLKGKAGTKQLHICALGGAVGTKGSIEAEVIMVKELSELEALGRDQVEGKIVFYNRALNPVLINTGAAYGGAYDQRSRGAIEAAKYGAVGTLVRSLTHALDTLPHTGAMNYEEGIDSIPAAAISTVDANYLSEQLKLDPNLKIALELSCERHPDRVQANVIAEIRGSEFPEEYIVVGGHLDSWDIGEGAHDDGAGIVQSIEVLRTYRALGIQPKHSLRIVLFINEENGNRGGIGYAEAVKENNEEHIAALESDSGGFSPRGFSMEGSDEQAAKVRSWAELFEPYNIHLFRRGWSGVDIRPLKNDRILLMGLVPDNQRYFDYHHSKNDVFESVHKRELELGAAAMTSLIYLLDQYAP